VFIIRFFTGSILGIISGIVLSVILMIVLFGAVTIALMATGGPDPCEPGGGDLVISQANSDAFQRKWDAFELSLDRGVAATVTFTESEIASRAEAWVNEEDAPFEDIRVCLHEGEGEGSGTVKLFGTFDVNVLVEGTLDLSGDKPEATIEDIEVGNVPGFMMAPVERIVERAIEEGMSDLEIEHDLDLDLSPGEAVVSGTP
jgi:hypothetical protein